MLILAYHRVNPEVRDGLSVSPETLREHLETLRARGLRNLVLEDVIGGSIEEIPTGAFAITFDDGYQDNIVHAEPVLRALGMKATVYLVASMIDSDEPFPWLDASNGFDDLDLHMTTAQLHQGLEGGAFTYGSHTLTHPKLSTLDRREARQEISESKERLERHLGIDVTTFCYPAGDFNEETVDLVAEAGYSAAVVTPNRHIQESALTLHRVGIYSHITPRLFSMKTSAVFSRAQHSRTFWGLRHWAARRRES